MGAHLGEHIWLKSPLHAWIFRTNKVCGTELSLVLDLRSCLLFLIWFRCNSTIHSDALPDVSLLSQGFTSMWKLFNDAVCLWNVLPKYSCCVHILKPIFTYSLLQVNGEIPQYRSTATRTSLTIRDLIKRDHGIYECRATNEIATIVTSTTLYVECKYCSTSTVNLIFYGVINFRNISKPYLKGALYPVLKINMFCVLSQNYQTFFKKIMRRILKLIVQGTQKWHWNNQYAKWF